MLTGEHLVRDETLVGELHEVELVVLEPSDIALLALDLPSNDLSALCGVVSHICPHSVPNFLSQLDSAVVLLDCLRDELDRIVAGVAATAPSQNGTYAT